MSIDHLLKRIEVFNDSYELADALQVIADYDSVARYYCIESADNLVGMFNLLMDIKRKLSGV